MYHEVIKSPNNPRIKHIKSLHIKKYRDKHGLYLVEGIKMVKEALARDTPLECIIYSQDFDIKTQDLEIDPKTTPIFCVTPRILKDISDVENPQGIIAILEQDYKNIDIVFKEKRGLWVVLDGIQDPGNLGTIIRTIDAAGGSGIILLEGCVDPYNTKVVRATMGSIFRVSIVQALDTAKLLESIKDARGEILASAMEGKNIFNWKNTKPGGLVTLVIGNESRGISQEIIAQATEIISIPIAGEAESLNASVAAGIMIYDIMRKA